jgi:hypothetical protein
MIRSKAQELGALPDGLPETMYSEYLRGKMEERNHSSGTFTKRGNDVWAERSGRTFFSDGSELKGGAMDYASPVAGSGMGNLSRLTGGVKSKSTMPKALMTAIVSGSLAEAAQRKGGSAVDALEIKNMMQRGMNRAQGTIDTIGSGKKGKNINARAAIVKKIMSQRGVSMIEASKIVKSEGLY